MSGGKKSVDGWDDDDWEKESDKGLSTESPSDWSPDELDKKEERQDEREEGKRTKKTNKTKTEKGVTKSVSKSDGDAKGATNKRKRAKKWCRKHQSGRRRQKKKSKDICM